MKKEIIRINNLSYKVKDGDEEKMLLNNISIRFRKNNIFICNFRDVRQFKG